jgi:hypothetical protein
VATPDRIWTGNLFIDNEALYLMSYGGQFRPGAGVRQPRRPSVTPTSSHTPPPQPSARVTAENSLADTGVPGRALTDVGLALLALGVIVTRVGRQTRSQFWSRSTRRLRLDQSTFTTTSRGAEVKSSSTGEGRWTWPATKRPWPSSACAGDRRSDAAASGCSARTRSSRCSKLSQSLSHRRTTSPALGDVVNYFLGALGELIQRMTDVTATYGLALTNNKQYRGLVQHLPGLARGRLNLAIFYVDRASTVARE